MPELPVKHGKVILLSAEPEQRRGLERELAQTFATERFEARDAVYTLEIVTGNSLKDVPNLTKDTQRPPQAVILFYDTLAPAERFKRGNRYSYLNLMDATVATIFTFDIDFKGCPLYLVGDLNLEEVRRMKLGFRLIFDNRYLNPKFYEGVLIRRFKNNPEQSNRAVKEWEDNFARSKLDPREVVAYEMAQMLAGNILSFETPYDAARDRILALCIGRDIARAHGYTPKKVDDSLDDLFPLGSDEGRSPSGLC